MVRGPSSVEGAETATSATDNGQRTTDNELSAIQAALDAAADRRLNAIRKNHTETRSIEEVFGDIRAEMVNNRVDTATMLERIDDGIVTPLHQINEMDYPEVDRNLALFKLVNEEGNDATGEIDRTLAALDVMLDRMNAVLRDMRRSRDVQRTGQTVAVDSRHAGEDSRADQQGPDAVAHRRQVQFRGVEVKHHRTIPLTFLAVALLAGFAASPSIAQDDAVPDAAGPSAVEGQDEQPLHILEQALLRDYERFEEKLLELAEYTRRNDPDRAELLVRTRSESTSRRVEAQMKRIADALAPSESGDVLYGDALARQEELIADLTALLKLLQSEDERDRIDREIARLKDLVKDTERLIGEQKDVRADTERGGDPSKLAGDQQDVNERADALAEKIDRQDAEKQAEEDRKSARPANRSLGSLRRAKPSRVNRRKGRLRRVSNPNRERSLTTPTASRPMRKPTSRRKANRRKARSLSDPKEGESKPGEPQDGKPSDGKPSDGTQTATAGRQTSRRQPQEGQPQEGQPGEQQESPSQPSQSQQTPGREQLEEARERMEKAIEELKLERLDKASGEQDAALAKLEEMKAQLEEILRQLREEEKKLFLMALEARFQRMLERQLNINNDTLKLYRVAEAERDDDRHMAESTRLSRNEGDNVTDAEKALMLLREDGSSVAFPEAVEMMRDNMREVVGRLQRGETDETTQLLERMIVESLEEMIFALQREMEKQDEKKQDQQQQQQEPTDPSLMDKLAELKMVRSLQSQVNRLTRQYGLEIDGEQATNPDDLTFLRNLAKRQERIQEATYDLSIGKNK